MVENVSIQHEGGEPTAAKEDEDETNQDEKQEQDAASDGENNEQDGEEDN